MLGGWWQHPVSDCLAAGCSSWLCSCLNGLLWPPVLCSPRFACPFLCAPPQALGKPRLSTLERAKLEAKQQAEAAAAAAQSRSGSAAAAPAVPSLDAALAPPRKTKLQLEKEAAAAADKARAAAQRLAAAKAAAAARAGGA